MKSPCRPDCPRRAPACHGSCRLYLAYWDVCQRERKERGVLVSAAVAASEGIRKAYNRKHAKKNIFHRKCEK